MESTKITSVELLRDYLDSALQIEHATIPPYLTALYSIIPGTNSDAYHVLRVAVVEEMLHLTIVANLLNAVGGSPDLTVPTFVPRYPTYLPTGETDFKVSLQRFSRECIENFVEIERPREAPTETARHVSRAGRHTAGGNGAPHLPHMHFFSIGEFYREIRDGFDRLHHELGDALFSGRADHQVTNEYFYSGGGEVVTVTDLRSAREGLDLIARQGEGLGAGIYDSHRELAHYYRFQQLTLGRYYQAGDRPGEPTGPPLSVDWDASYPIKRDATVADYPMGSEVRAAAEAFNTSYSEFLGLLTRAFTGEPDLLLTAVGSMFRLRDQMTQLIHNPIPGIGSNAAPTFEVASVAAVAS